MNIYIDIERMIGANGKACLYYPQVHWSIDEQDTISPATMDMIKEYLEKQLNDCLKAVKIER